MVEGGVRIPQLFLVLYYLCGLYLERFKGDDHIDIVLNTDSEDLIKLVEQVKDLNIGILRRDASLAGDKVAKVSVILDCINRAEELNGVKYDIVCDLDITSPLRTVQDVKNAIDRKKQRNEICTTGSSQL